MLNEKKNNIEGNACFGDGASMYSLVSEAKDSGPYGGNSGDESSSCSADGSVVMESNNAMKVGLLILEGEECRDGDDDESKHIDDKSASRLSIPETVLLPSEIGSVAAVSCVTNEHDKRNEKGRNSDNQIFEIIMNKWLRVLTFVSGWRASLSRRFHPYATQLFLALIVFATLASFASWRSHVWKNETLRLRQELQKQKALLPLTLSLLKERESLVKQQKLLEQEIQQMKSHGNSNYEGIFSPDGSDDDKLVSFKNCYIEASLSLGRCSKELQKRWYGSDNTSGSDRPTKEETSNENDLYDYDGAFTEDISKLVKHFTNSLSSTTAQSYSFIEKSLKYMSYDGIREAFYADGDNQSIIEDEGGILI